jgi:5'-3' exonuclease
VLATCEGPLNEEDLLKNMWDYTKSCISSIAPSAHIGIYVDGVAPVAKINQQRKRRYLSVLRHKLLQTKPLWDTNAISPGTPFMIRLHAFVRGRLRDESNMRHVFSGSDEPGEGEHKIFADIATTPADDCVFIHGLDADLIMLSLMAHRPNMFLVREPSYPYTPESTEDGFLYLDIHNLRCAILKHLASQFHWDIPSEAMDDVYNPMARNVIETYVVLCFILGNDFLPHGPALTLKKDGYERVLDAAKHAMLSYPNGAVDPEKGGVCLPFLADVFQRLMREENDLLWRANEDYMRRKPSMRADQADAFPLQPQNKSPLANVIYHTGQPSRWRAYYYKHLFFSKMHDTRIIATACREYITGILWTYAYYKRHPRPYDWYYPYGYPPSILDIANFLQANIGEWESLQTRWRTECKTPKWLNMVVQLLCILPKESAALIPHNYRTLMTHRELGCSHMFPDEYPLLTYMHAHLWECVPVLPALDVAWLNECMADIDKKGV